MGIRRKNGGYSADVSGYFVLDGKRIRLAKTNGKEFVLAEPCELEPGAEGELLVIVDGQRSSRFVKLPQGTVSGRAAIEYTVTAPF